MISGYKFRILSTVFYSCNGDDPNGPDKPPVISVFQANPVDIVPGDSSLLTYQVSDATSLVLSPVSTNLPSVSSGSVYVSPPVPTEYLMVAYNSDGVDSATVKITMNSVIPIFINFLAEPGYINAGDSARISWEINRMDSLVIDNGYGTKLDSIGNIYVKPSVNTVYVGIAYNDNVADTMTVAVDVPVNFSVLNGLFYRGMMNSSVQDPLMQFQAFDLYGQSSQNVWIKAEIVEGDGTLSADSVQPGSNDTASFSYNFDGNLGHAVVRTWVDDLDTTDLFIRAKTIIPGDLFQGQYMLYRDTYATVRALNGDPNVIDSVGGGILALVYEDTLVPANNKGVVYLVGEVGTVNGQVSLMDTVYYMMITYPIGGTTADGLTVGSTYPEMVASLGTPQSSYASGDFPADTILYYDSLGLLFWCNRSDTVVNQVDLLVPNTVLTSPGNDSDLHRRVSSATASRKYKLIY